MTLLVAFANTQRSVLVVDRRVSSKQVILNDEYNKATVFICEDAKLAVAFTGLATHGGFSTAKWLTETLSDICQSTLSVHEVLATFAARAGSQFATLAAEDRRTTFLFCGFIYSNGASEPRIYSVSNFEHGPHDPSSFTTSALGGPDQTITSLAGTTAPVPDSVPISLHRLLAADLKHSSLVRFAVKHLQLASKSLKSLNQIGEHCTAIVITSQPNTPIVTTYHTTKNSNTAYGPNIVVARHFTGFGTEVMSGSVLAGPEIRKQDPCWCESGVSFKHCHMKKFGGIYVRHAAWKRPLIPFMRLGIDSPWPVGQHFLVGMGYE